MFVGHSARAARGVCVGGSVCVWQQVAVWLSWQRRRQHQRS